MITKGMEEGGGIDEMPLSLYTARRLFSMLGEEHPSDCTFLSFLNST
jgi:hypothetical protein